MHDRLENLSTESRNEETRHLDTLSIMQILQLMNAEEKKVPYAIEGALEQVAAAVACTIAALEAGGRLFYFGAGTSGRLGVLDAAECPPTFGTPPELVQGIIAGGPAAIMRAIEGAEDDEQLGLHDVQASGVTAQDVVVGIAASGRTPYVIGALAQARSIGAKTIALSCVELAQIDDHADYTIKANVGAEIVTGSTRLKAGSATKQVLNMLTTATMIKLGKVYGNLMVNVQATNNKLRERVKRIVMEVTGVTYEEAEQLAQQADGDAKTAILIKLTGSTADEARRLLLTTQGRLREAIELFE